MLNGANVTITGVTIEGVDCTAKIAKIHESYKNKQALLDKLEALFELYYNVTKDSSTGPPKRAITKNKAKNTLAELLA
ncbi:hypothetical protein GLOIN_2v1882940 [Rhizophagus irregularis DAOM 181602=DAOM 197198]|nr:hypothetical protein GLOIN_2v1882940 [Rhizophagus irregularis DAOM 181602=DAOM 197198]